MTPSLSWRASALLALFAAPVVTAQPIPDPPDIPDLICRVAPDGGNSGTGESWASPIALQRALGMACTEIWLRKGIYKPVVPANAANPTEAEREASFVVRGEAQLYGGFAGNETIRSRRKPDINRTVLSGDIDNNDIVDTDGITTRHDDLRGNNSYHVVTLTGRFPRIPVTRDTVLDGLVITAGHANGSSQGSKMRGGGLYCVAYNTLQDGQCSPTLRNVLFSGNKAYWEGGAMALDGSGDGSRVEPLLERVRFVRNQADTFDGGALYIATHFGGVGKPDLIEVEFTGNRANSISSRGGAMYNAAYENGSVVNPTLHRVSFHDNQANAGGAMKIYTQNGGTSQALVINSSFTNNRAVGSESRGSAIHNDAYGVGTGGHSRVNMHLINATLVGNTSGQAPMSNKAGNNGGVKSYLTNVTFYGNDGTGASSMYNEGPFVDSQLHEVIMWCDTLDVPGTCAGTMPQIGSSYGPAGYGTSITRSLIAGGCPAQADCQDTVLDVDPRLQPPALNGGTTLSMHPRPDSPVIDAGGYEDECFPVDQRGVSRPQGLRCDIGAVEATDTIFADGFDGN